MTDKIEVTQADERAAEKFDCNATGKEFERIIQAFARHAAQWRVEGARMMQEAVLETCDNIGGDISYPVVCALSPADIVKGG